MSLLVIILAALVAISLLIFFVGITADNQAQATNYDIDWSVLSDEEFQSYLPHKKINAIKRYRELTGLGLKEAKQAVEYVIAHPEQKKVKSGLAANTGGAGVRDLLLDNRFEEAVDVYAAFMGVDEFTARDAIHELQREINAEANLMDIDTNELRQLIDEDNKIGAYKRYMAQTGASLEEAKQFIEMDL